MKCFHHKPNHAPDHPSSLGPLPLFTCKEALIAQYDVGDALKLLVLHSFSHNAYAWVGSSSNCKQKMNNLMKTFPQDPLVMLQIHGVRWLPHGQVMKQMGLCNHDLWMVHQLARLTQTLPTSASNPFQYNNVWERFLPQILLIWIFMDLFY